MGYDRTQVEVWVSSFEGLTADDGSKALWLIAYLCDPLSTTVGLPEQYASLINFFRAMSAWERGNALIRLADIAEQSVRVASRVHWTEARREDAARAKEAEE